VTVDETAADELVALGLAVLGGGAEEDEEDDGDGECFAGAATRLLLWLS
jgi:hypothetical protein